MSDPKNTPMRATTVLAVRTPERTVMVSDGQVTHGNIVMKASAKKVRMIHNGKILAGFAGGTADAFALFERLEGKLQESGGNLLRSSVELAKDWRTDRALRRLEAMLIVADKDRLLLVSGNGDVVEPDEPVLAIGSGGPFALSAARALLAHTDLSAEDVANSAMQIASDLCIYTNDSRTMQTIEHGQEGSS